MRDVVFITDFLREGVDPGREFIRKLAQVSLSVLQNFVGDNGKFINFESDALCSGFKIEQFKILAGIDWVSSFWGVGQAAKDYIVRFLPSDRVYIGYELSPWLVEVLNEIGASWVDIRLSPYRFSRDLYFSVRAGPGVSLSGMAPRAINRDILTLEAGLVKAAVAHNVRKRNVPNLEDSVVFFGQTPGDASLIHTSGAILTLENYFSQIRLLSEGRRLIYKPHPYAGRHAHGERAQFKRILGYRPSIVKFDTYSLLSLDSIFSVSAISSGVCLEAEIFGKEASCLFNPICQPLHKDWMSIAISDFYSPWFWSVIFGMDKDLPQPLPELPLGDSNLARRTHNAWWGYSDFMFENDDFWRKSVSMGIKKALKNAFRWRHGA